MGFVLDSCGLTINIVEPKGVLFNRTDDRIFSVLSSADEAYATLLSEYISSVLKDRSTQDSMAVGEDHAADRDALS